MDPWICSCGCNNAPEHLVCGGCGVRRDATVRVAHMAALSVGQPAARLVGLSPALAGMNWPVLEAHPLTVGRSAGNEIGISGDPSVSGIHARIYWANPYYALEDLRSTNGTYVNGQRVAGSVAVHHGDVIQVGETRFQFILDAPLTAYAPPPVYAPPPPYPPPAAPYGYPYPPVPYGPARKDRVAAGVLAILLGGLGIHLFYLNKVGWGIAFLLFTLLTCGYGGLLTGLIALVQGILYLCASEPDFHQKYVVEQRFF